MIFSPSVQIEMACTLSSDCEARLLKGRQRLEKKNAEWAKEELIQNLDLYLNLRLLWSKCVGDFVAL